MTFNPRRSVGLSQRFLALLSLLALLGLSLRTPSASAAAPKIVSVDVTGNLHVPTATIMSVVAARPGQPYDPKIVQADLARINALGYFADIAPPLIRQRPGGIAITYRVVENPVLTKIGFVGQSEGPERHALRADGPFRRSGLQHEHVPRRRAQDQ